MLNRGLIITVHARGFNVAYNKLFFNLSHFIFTAIEMFMFMFTTQLCTKSYPAFYHQILATVTLTLPKALYNRTKTKHLAWGGFSIVSPVVQTLQNVHEGPIYWIFFNFLNFSAILVTRTKFGHVMPSERNYLTIDVPDISFFK